MLQRDQDIYASAPLRRLLDDQMRAMAPDLQRCFGAHALLVGASANDAPPARLMFSCWTRLRVDEGRYRGDLQAATDEPLPFLDDAFELVMLRHALEVVAEPSAVLADAIRVLAPGGVLVLTGVHPLSGWAPWFYWRARGTRPVLQLPLRLMQVMQGAGLDIERVRRVGRIFPRTTAAGPEGISAWGGGYVLIARKRHRAATPLRIKPVPLRVPANSQLSPGTRRSSVL
ncbi:methyltransferase domain-containing protein [Rhodanobacter sp. MP7CTX1]|jgi:SAM-dependent methyltransferase|uniref:class I SAM-dependent methyltransferase n=1 Tax=Rhodanobacter sp. MP7CTX1 TaxID=2723084 RepID=UPI00160DE6B9|nr:methyltransferase domain-containing protein [Rhodanobacter sp. MP7CTX1]MBB6185812.1 SAM-dependent methyltransferase [Rhodanobacter sp. MP7CTX1]